MATEKTDISPYRSHCRAVLINVRRNVSIKSSPKLSQHTETESSDFV